MGKILKTSTCRISNSENGKGVMMANHLIASYKLVLELERIKQKGHYFQMAGEDGIIYRVEAIL